MSIYVSKNIYYVYAYIRSKDSLVAPVGSPYYIGKGSNGRAFNKKHGSIPVPKDKSNIIFIETKLSENKAFEIEKFLIGYYGRKDIGTGILLNKTDGGEGVSGHKPSEETKQKLSIAKSGENHYLYGKTHSEVTKRKMSIAQSGKKNHQYGKTRSEETLKKMSDSHKGQSHSEEARTKISIANIGKIHSEETRKKMSRATLNMPIVKCPHCEKIGKGNTMKRWHFDNCKVYLNAE